MAAKKSPAKSSYVGPAWTKAQRAALHGVRRPHPLDPPSVPTTAEAGWRAFLAGAAALEERLGAVRTDTARAAELLAPVLRSIKTEEPPRSLDTVTEQLRAHLVLDPSDHNGDPTPGLQGLVAFWCAAFGVEELFTLARARHVFGLGSWSSGEDSGRSFSGEDTQASSPSRGLGVLEYPQVRIALRRYLFALPQEVFKAQSAAFKRRCLETFDQADERFRDAEGEASVVAFVLGRDGSHAHALLRRDKKGAIAYVQSAGWLLASITDLELATAAVASLGTIMVFEGASLALDFVETFGADAAPLLEAILATTVNKRPKLPAFYARRLNAAIKLAKSAPPRP